MQIIDFLNEVRPLITGGCKFEWNCYGPNARFLDFGDHSSIVYDFETQKIYEVTFIEKQNPELYVAFKWIDSEYKKEYVKEYKKHYMDPEFVERHMTLETVMKKIKEELNDD